MNAHRHEVAVIGAGPAGIFAAERLAKANVAVSLLNRDERPGGLAEFGIFPSKVKMKVGLRKQFQRILEQEKIHYHGGVTVGNGRTLTLSQLQELGFDALLVAVGAQGTKWLGLPGESLQGVFHAKELVYHYNELPPFDKQTFRIGQRIAIIGVGNVMIDVAHWLIRYAKADEVIAIARRGAADIKFTPKELKAVAANLESEHLQQELSRIAPIMLNVGQDPTAAQAHILSALEGAQPAISDSCLRFRFMSSPTQIIDNGNGEVIGLEIEETILVSRDNGRTSAQGTGVKRILNVDTVIFAIGDSVDTELGLPVKWNAYAHHPQPRYPINSISYEAYDPAAEVGLDGIFLAGWARQASSGLVGVARKDGRNAAEAVLAYLADHPAKSDHAGQKLRQILA